jgi:hypothetical protein
MNYAAEAAKGSRQLLTGLAAGETDEIEASLLNHGKGLLGTAGSSIQSATGVDVSNLITKSQSTSNSTVAKNKEKEIDKFILDASAEFTSLPSSSGKDPLAVPMSDEEIDAFIANHEQTASGKFFAKAAARTRG